MKNYYEVLEVDIKASQEMIDRAFKLLAKRYHPDTHPKEKKAWAEEKFKEINEAYEILSNVEKRSVYDIDLEYVKESELTLLLEENERLKRLVEQLQSPQNSTSSSYTNSYTPPEHYVYEDFIKEETFTNHILSLITNKFKSLLALFLTLVFIIFIGFILWNIPFTHDYLVHFYENNPMIKVIIDFIMKFFS